MHGRGTGARVRTCAAFPGNQIPASRINPISQKLLEFYPEPNAAGTVNNYVSQQNRVINKDQYTQRVDFVQSSTSPGWAATATAEKTKSLRR